MIMKLFSIHWILKNERVPLPMNSLIALPSVGDEIRASRNKFYTVARIVWCLDEPHEFGQRVNIEIKRAK